MDCIYHNGGLCIIDDATGITHCNINTNCGDPLTQEEADEIDRRLKEPVIPFDLEAFERDFEASFDEATDNSDDIVPF
jgi:hypothetical protein